MSVRNSLSIVFALALAGGSLAIELPPDQEVLEGLYSASRDRSGRLELVDSVLDDIEGGSYLYSSDTRRKAFEVILSDRMREYQSRLRKIASMNVSSKAEESTLDAIVVSNALQILRLFEDDGAIALSRDQLQSSSDPLVVAASIQNLNEFGDWSSAKSVLDALRKSLDLVDIQAIEPQAERSALSLASILGSSIAQARKEYSSSP
jgi:HEAT repeat protein